MDKLQTVRDTLKDANEINEYKEKELNEKVKLYCMDTNFFKKFGSWAECKDGGFFFVISYIRMMSYLRLGNDLRELHKVIKLASQG